MTQTCFDFGVVLRKESYEDIVRNKSLNSLLKEAHLDKMDRKILDIFMRRNKPMAHSREEPLPIGRMYFSEKEHSIFFLSGYNSNSNSYSRYLFLFEDSLNDDVWSDYGLFTMEEPSYYDITDIVFSRPDPSKKDYCQECHNEELYWHAMSAKCSMCHKIILGG